MYTLHIFFILLYKIKVSLKEVNWYLFIFFCPLTFTWIIFFDDFFNLVISLNRIVNLIEKPINKELKIKNFLLNII